MSLRNDGAEVEKSARYLAFGANVRIRTNICITFFFLDKETNICLYSARLSAGVRGVFLGWCVLFLVSMCELINPLHQAIAAAAISNKEPAW